MEYCDEQNEKLTVKLASLFRVGDKFRPTSGQLLGYVCTVKKIRFNGVANGGFYYLLQSEDEECFWYEEEEIEFCKLQIKD